MMTYLHEDWNPSPLWYLEEGEALRGHFSQSTEVSARSAWYPEGQYLCWLPRSHRTWPCPALNGHWLPPVEGYILQARMKTNVIHKHGSRDTSKPSWTRGDGCIHWLAQRKRDGTAPQWWWQGTRYLSYCCSMLRPQQDGWYWKEDLNTPVMLA